MHSGDHGGIPVRPADAGSRAAAGEAPAARGWRRLAGVPALPANEIHVWRCHVDVAARGEPLPECLDAAERLRAERFSHAGARAQFVVARAGLRTIAAGYLGADAAELRFATASGGKPELAGAHAGSGLRFSVAHAGGHALLAFSRGGEVGVDVEAAGRRLDWEPVADRYLTAAEAAALRALPAARRREAFLLAWCCKEALGKLTGDGILAALGGTEVPIPLGARPVVVPTASGGAWLRRLFPGGGAVGALACATRPRAVRCLEWLPPPADPAAAPAQRETEPA